eukprot:420607-Ditylum_brightwellii.AAC.1
MNKAPIAPGHRSMQSQNPYIKSDMDQTIAVWENIHRNKCHPTGYDKEEEKKKTVHCWLSAPPICPHKQY